MTDEKIRELIEAIDRFHGNALKDRSDAHIQQEVSVIKAHLLDCLLDNFSDAKELTNG